MKLRRALAAAAATAAIAPAALLAAPAAFAETPSESPSPSASETVTPSPEDPAPSETPTDEATPTTPAPSTSATQAPTPGDPGGTPSSTPTETATPTPTPTPTSTSTEEPGDGECADDGDYNEDPELSTTLVGLPSKVVAGSGFHGFKFQVKNESDRAYQRVDFGVFAGTVHESAPDGTGKHLTLQYKDPKSGAWKAISTDESDPGSGYIGYTDVRPHETLTVDLRLSVAKSAPEGFGYAISVGVYADDEGNCVYSTGEYYEFDVLKAGSEPGHVPPADPKPQGGKKPLPHKPEGDTEISPKGSLAETGSSSALPMIAVIGGVAMAAGGGAVFVVRRRRATV
ncbi:LAETG motif-containing sortase-dependent surface protein [Streptomyces rapamycinicus]|uniref:Peptidase n=2 Tax=Streptomyces rapamycinicus TaxID=1226757 RepID=A0A0A0NRE6_STRRN|nr:LAETG motif-containing sortase-dependent surface protein [Streptomyces rapamycinicus]AGP57115.1 peptidase [Streptomyces rapamycinicus NRRL 5491]MBB4784750.1 LPXTG-motif cell wall-anchored protein [Streptomyces rapamycinicus]RLV79772.1 peptidase [Streptomyces rapamycinicus NRRL 5491]UTO65010.1 LPXTG cell wall anchor domain-containing protein [Streptomyces rapamycinicus]UTP32966.1 LPXTG cell wall anchor domain-containing protein [Streptomyces rapamycinicus NRRL 5491]